MPTYWNNTANSITFNGEIWAPTETKSVSYAVPDEYGLEKVSDQPPLQGSLIHAGVLTLDPDETESVYIPDCKYFSLHVILSDGDILLRENSDTNQVASPIASGVNFFCAEVSRKDVERYFFTAGSGGATVSYTISRLTRRH